MIFDTAKNLDFYKTLGVDGRYAKAVEFLKNTDLKNLAPGKYEIDGKNVFANVMEYETIPWENAKYEAHKNYTDIQYMIEGEEVMTYIPVEELTPKNEYNPEKDVINFVSVPGLDVLVGPDEYAIFMPWDGHMPKVMNGQPQKIKKVVVKICEV